MKANEVNQIVICKSNFKSTEEFENAVKDAIMVLLNNDYIMTVEYDVRDKELGNVVIEFNYAEKEFGCDYPYWLSPEEWESVVWDNEKNE